MCTWGDTLQLEVTIPAHLSHTRADRRAIVGVDRCIHQLVKALNEAGFATVACCCGHGHRPGNIALADGRELVIARDYEEARRIDGLFPFNIQGERIPVGPGNRDREHLRWVREQSRTPCNCHDCDGRWCTHCLEHHGKKPCPMVQAVRRELAEARLARRRAALSRVPA